MGEIGGSASAGTGRGRRREWACACQSAPLGPGTRGSLCAHGDRPAPEASWVSAVDVRPWMCAHTVFVCVLAFCVSGCLCAHVWVLSVCLQPVFPCISELMCTCVYLSVTSVHASVYLWVCEYVCASVDMCVCVLLNLCVHLNMYVCAMFTRLCVCVHSFVSLPAHVHFCVYESACVSVCAHICTQHL